MPIYFKNSTKINLHITYSVKTQYFVIANLMHTNKKSNIFCGNFTLTLRNVQGIIYAGISTYIQSVVRNLVWLM